MFTTKAKVIAALFWVAVILTACLIPHQTIQGWDFQGMWDACAHEAQTVRCQYEVDDLKYATERLSRAYDLKIQHQITRYRVEQAERMARIAREYPKAWEVRHLVR